MLGEAIEIVALFIDVAGIGVIFWGVGVGLLGLLGSATGRLKRNDTTNNFNVIARTRCQLGSYILLGLEILIAADIARTVVEPTYEKVILLGAIVGIRTVLSFFLSRELEAIANPSS